jgi:signal transduction histidine kinase
VQGSIDVIDKSLELNDIERTKRSWQILRQNLDKVNKLVLDMLKYSGESPPQLTSCDINDLIDAVVRTLSQQAEKDAKTITLIADPRIESIDIDVDQIYDVMLNLLLNALDAIDKDTGKIEVTTKLDEQNKHVIIKVSDNGPGIADTESIFEPFHSSKPKLGTGLGLPIARKIITQHNGTVQVRSKLAHGATFTIILPA